MKKIICLLLGCMVVFISCQKKEVSAPIQKPVIKIGVILPLTGNLGFLGEVMRDGVLMAKEDLKLNENTKFHYEIIFEDDQLDPRKTATAAQKLINVDKVDAIFSFSSGSGNVISPLTEKNKIIHICAAADPKVAEGKYNFNHWTTPDEMANALKKVLQEKKLLRIAALILNHQGTQATLEHFQKCIEGSDVKIVSLFTVNTGERDFRIMINRSQQAHPDVYIIFLFPPELEICVKQLKEQNITQPIASAEAFNYSASLDLFEGKWFIDAADMSDAMQNKFYQKYKHKTTAVVGNFYDMLKMIVEICEKSPLPSKPTSDQIADALLNLENFEGALGKLTVDKEGIFHSKPTLKEIRNGKPVVIKRDL